jgi:hypothetical protein
MRKSQVQVLYTAPHYSEEISCIVLQWLHTLDRLSIYLPHDSHLFLLQEIYQAKAAPIIKTINISPLAKINEIIRKMIRREILINVIICCILKYSYEL